MSDFYSFALPNLKKHKIGVTPSTQLLLDSARRLGLQTEIIDDSCLIAISNGKITHFFQGQTPDSTNFIGFYATEDKGVARSLLQRIGLSIPKGFVIRDNVPKEALQAVYDSLKKPLVVKPTDGTQGKSVFMSISDFNSYVDAVNTSLASCVSSWRGAVVEEQFLGDEYRIVASRNKIFGIVKRVPANVIGDGLLTIEELINRKNSDPRRSPSPEAPLVTIKIDEHVSAHLNSNGIKLTDVPSKDEIIFLRKNSNISTGGDSIDVTDLAHPSVTEIALRAINAFPGLGFAGIDFMTVDISTEQTPSSYSLIELNKSPGFSIHTFPYSGKSRPIADMLLQELFMINSDYL